jgi:hypothetical protein
MAQRCKFCHFIVREEVDHIQGESDHAPTA